MAIIQSYRGNAKKINLRVKRTMPIDDTDEKKKKKDSKRKVKLSDKKKSKPVEIKVVRR